MDPQTKTAVDRALEVARLAGRRREALRRRTKPAEPKREESLAAMIERLRKAMVPIRAEIGRLPYKQTGPRDERALRDASAKLKYERKQIRKMQRG